MAEHISLDKIPPPFKTKIDETEESHHFWRRHDDLRTRRQRAMRRAFFLETKSSVHRIFPDVLPSYLLLFSSFLFSLVFSLAISMAIFGRGTHKIIIRHPTSPRAGKGKKTKRDTGGVNILYRLEFFCFFSFLNLFSIFPLFHRGAI